MLNNTIAAVEDGRQPLLRHLEPQAPSPRVINRLEVIFEELVSNIVRHGFKAGSDQSIVVVAAVRPGEIELTFEDDGVPFDPLAVAPPEPFTSLETAKLGGLGIATVRKLSASVRYEALAAEAQPRILGGRPFRPRNRLTVSIATST